MIRYLKIALAWCFSFAFVTGIVVALTFTFGPMVETRFFPVISDVKATPVQVDKDTEILHLAALGTKVRQCEWKEITAMVLRDGQWRQGSVYFTDPRSTPTPRTQITISRPVGSQSLGEIFVFPSGEAVRIYLYHTCHPFWQSTTFLYELDFNRVPRQVR